ncbi:GNAT family N-acetyltransferase [Kitasatospora sp. GP82]|uniref:GNAT family N-acetyltransferase n=1 Tax=Kitasatospora sp. GP82 TaxID=3035089 RepID=UPI0024738DDA|nr:GNAT family N-acetyltransferase [Kitasatospora sp. GP82]
MDIASFFPARATEREISECYEVSTAAFSADFPGRPVPSCAAFAEQLRMPTSLLGTQRFWVARAHGRIVGMVTLTLPDRENLQLTITSVRVALGDRRRGIGTALLRATLPDARTVGRVVVTGQGLKVGGDGEKWASSLGFGKVQEFVLQSLTVPDVDPDLWRVTAPAGFRTEQWTGAAPQGLVAGYARARTAIMDAPTGESSLRFPDWTVDRVRQHEADLRERGEEQRIVVAVHERTGTVAGLTEMVISSARPTVGYQQETAVLPAFRGHGLGRFIKARQMQWLTAERPEIDWVATNTAADNAHMIRVNHQVGYRTDATVADVEAQIDTLEAH